MLRALAVAFSIALPLTIPPPPPIAPGPSVGEVPTIESEAWIVVDSASGIVLAGKDIDVPRPMASVTKIMTAMVVVDNAAMDEVVVISDKAADVGESEIGVVAGELWTVGDLLKAMMVRSGNDAAVALAEYVGGSIDGFSEMMNAKATELGLENSQFRNPHGLDDDGHYTTPYDLAIMAQAALGYPEIAEAARVRVVQFAPDPMGNPRVANATNQLLGRYPGVIGLKTGYTAKAKKVLVTVARISGREIVTVVMGAEDHFADTTELLAWATQTYGLSERLLALGRPEQGGSGISAYPPGIADDVVARVVGIQQLKSVGDPATVFEGSELADEIESWLRANMPGAAGGSGR
ncbi:D-alanyl-D-alanine carboxypeptidase DacB precursor [bacterium BMS3Bbin02]|nr:D-alanyl-D-alanine carboxypeptidase DacB precursor [bacterium BMS3Bbin02]